MYKSVYSKVVIDGTLYKRVWMDENKSSRFWIDVISLPPRNSTDVLFSKTSLRISRVLKGRAIWHIGDKNYDAEEGDIFVLNNTERRSIPVIFPPENLILQTLDFEPYFIWSDQNNMFDMSYLKIFFEKPVAMENKLHHDTESSKEICMLMQKMQNEMMNKQPEYKQMVKVLLQHILVILNRYYISKLSEYNFDSTPPKAHLAKLENVISYIDEHISEEIDLDYLAKITNMSQSHFRRLFKKYNGMSVTQYILKKRVLKVIEMIRNDDINVLDAAFKYGFNNSANFYKTFKSLTGKSPMYYRKNDIN